MMRVVIDLEPGNNPDLPILWELVGPDKSHNPTVWAAGLTRTPEEALQEAQDALVACRECEEGI